MTNILIVEDEAITAMDIKNRLNNFGFEVVGIASRGKEAIKKAGEYKPDLILMDVTLKGNMDGIEAANEIKSLFNIPVIYMSAFSDNNTFERLKLTNPYGFVNKPVSSELLTVSIEAAIYKHEMDKKLAKNENRYRSLYSSMAEGVAIYELLYDENNVIDCIISDVNPAYETLFGIKKSEIIGQRLTEFYELDELPFIDIYSEVAESGESAKFQAYFNPIDKFFDITVTSPEKGIFATFYEDITDRKKAVQNLVASEEKYRTLHESMCDAFAAVNMDGQITEFNDVFREMLGYTGEELYKLRYVDLTPEKWHKMEADIIDNHIIPQGFSDLYEKEYIRKDGSIIPVELKTFLIRDHLGEPIYMWAIVRDISERKKIDMALKENKKQLESLIELLPVGISIIDKDRNTVVTNKELERILTISKKGFKNRFYDKRKYIHSDGSNFPVDEMPTAIALKENRDVKDVEIGILKEDGSKMWTNVSAVNLPFTDWRAVVTTKDITKRKKTEEELKQAHENLEVEVEERTKELKEAYRLLKEREENYRELVQNVRNIILKMDKNGNITFFNEYAEYFFGFKHEEIIGKNIIGTILPETESSGRDLNKMVDKILKMPYLHEFNENENITKNGKRFWISWSNKGIYNKDGELISILSVGTNITERKKAEKELKNQVALLDISYEAIFSWEYDDGILSWNKGAKRLYGYNKEETIGKVSHELLKTKFPLGLNELLKKLDSDKIWTGELIHNTKNGREIIVESYMQLIQENSGKRIVIESNRDITERKKTENALKESENIYKALTESSPFIIRRLDREFNFLYSNKGTVNGLAKDDLIGRAVDEIGMDENVVEKWKTYGKKVFETGEIQELVDEISFSDGIKTLKTSIVPEFDVNNKIKAILLITQDISKLKKSEDKLKETIQKLERSNEELKQFAYVSSHDLQEPLRTIASFTQLLERRYKGKFDEDADEFMDYIVEAAKRMKEEIEGLLEYSKIETQGENFELVNMNEVLDYTLKTLDASVKESNAEIIYDKLPDVMGDSRQLQRVFQNLISNAIKFRKCEEPSIIQISASKDEDTNSYVFSVKDNGIGIEEQYMERIFKIFQRLHTRDVYNGTGIGLSIVKRIIERHGGRIWVESEYDVGSTFYFTIPILSEYSI